MRVLKQEAAFTLIEILIALMVFAILATISAMGLHAVLKSHERLKMVNNELMQISMAMTIMERDITQMIARPITTSSGEVVPALIIPDTQQFEFTRGGYTNALSAEKRSALQRVAYAFQNHQLIRKTWRQLDRAPHANPTARVLLNNVDSMVLSFIDPNGQQTDVWAGATVPNAIIVTFRLKKYGRVQGVFPIIGRGFNAST